MIDFRCTQCGRLLRTPDDAAGKQAQCPSCGAIQPVPAASASPASSSPFQDPATLPTPEAYPPHASSNPYAGSSYDPSALGAAGAQPIVPSRLDPGEVLSKTWQIAKDQIIWLFLYGLIYVIISQGVGQGLPLMVQSLKSVANLQGLGIDIISGVAVQLVTQIVSIFLSLGSAIYLLKMARGQPASLLDLFGGFPYLLRAFGALILLGLIVLGVVTPCFLPGLISAIAIDIESPLTIGLLIVGGLIAAFLATVLSLMFGLYLYAMVDRDAGVIESLTISRQITAGNRLVLFLIYILAGLIAMLGVCAFCLPVFFTLGFSMLMLAVSYLSMSGQSTAADRMPFSAGPQGIGGAGVQPNIPG